MSTKPKSAAEFADFMEETIKAVAPEIFQDYIANHLERIAGIVLTQLQEQARRQEKCPLCGSTRAHWTLTP